MNRRSFFGAVVAGSAALVLPKEKKEPVVVRAITVNPIMRISYADSADFEELRKNFARQLQRLEADRTYVMVMPPGVEKIDFVKV